MPTILFLNGWKFYFYSDEGNEPVHIHAEKAEKECKYWLEIELFEIREAFSIICRHATRGKSIR
jgi:hypothetical protein